MQRSRSRKQVLLLDCCYSGAFVHDRVIDETPGQMPGKWNFGVQGRIVIARNPNPVIKPVELPSELMQSIQDMRHWVREGAVRELERILRGSNKGLALSAQEALKGMLQDDSERVRKEVARILGSFAEAPPTEKPEQEKQIIEEADLTARTGVETEISQPEEKAETKIPIEQPPISPKRTSTTVPARVPTPMLVWLLPAILVPVISGIVVSIIFLSNKQPVISPPIVKPPEKIEEPSEPPKKVEKVVVPEIPKVIEKPKTVELPTNRPVISPEIKKMVFRSQPMRELSKESVESLVLTLAASGGILTTLIGVLQSWLTRHNQRSINLEVNGNKIDVQDITSEDQKRLIDSWISTVQKNKS